MIKAVREVIANEPEIKISTQVVRHVVQLYDILNMQLPGVLLLGYLGCGKTTLRNIVARTMKELAKQKVSSLRKK
jgi:Holliday junction resolvasome RuvABC ATP-dependent DNA helicase subunit